MKEKLLRMLIFCFSVLILQQGIAIGNDNIVLMGDHARVVEVNDIDPSALFYTEIDLALNAEKNIRKSLKE